MDVLREAKNQMREILDRMVQTNAPEIVLKGGYVPRVRTGSGLHPLTSASVSNRQLEMMTKAIMLDEQWKAFIRPASPRVFSFQLLALGIGRFKVDVFGTGFDIRLSIKPIRRPTDGAYVPFVPADHPPSLSAEAIPEI